MLFFKLVGGKSAADSRFSGTRGCSHLEGNILGHAVFFC